MVKRYVLETGYLAGDEDGGLVLYDDYKKLEAEVKRLKADLDHYESQAEEFAISMRKKV